VDAHLLDLYSLCMELPFVPFLGLLLSASVATVDAWMKTIAIEMSERCEAQLPLICQPRPIISVVESWRVHPTTLFHHVHSLSTCIPLSAIHIIPMHSSSYLIAVTVHGSTRKWTARNATLLISPLSSRFYYQCRHFVSLSHCQSFSFTLCTAFSARPLSAYCPQTISHKVQ